MFDAEGPARRAAAADASWRIAPTNQATGDQLQHQEIGEVVTVDETAVNEFVRPSKRMLDKPEEQAVGQEELQQAKYRHQHGRHADPTQQAADVHRIVDPLHDDDKQQAVTQEQRWRLVRGMRRERERAPAAQLDGAILGLPEWQQFGVSRGQSFDPGRRQRDNLQRYQADRQQQDCVGESGRQPAWLRTL